MQDLVGHRPEQETFDRIQAAAADHDALGVQAAAKLAVCCEMVLAPLFLF